jgi:hypothetical protein
LLTGWTGEHAIREVVPRTAIVNLDTRISVFGVNMTDTQEMVLRVRAAPQSFTTDAFAYTRGG